jgi:hypothetical protein
MQASIRSGVGARSFLGARRVQLVRREDVHWPRGARAARGTWRRRATDASASAVAANGVAPLRLADQPLTPAPAKHHTPPCAGLRLAPGSPHPRRAGWRPPGVLRIWRQEGGGRRRPQGRWGMQKPEPHPMRHTRHTQHTHAPNAPPPSKQYYICADCGWIYDQGEFSKAPGGFKCPVCKSPKSRCVCVMFVS